MRLLMTSVVASACIVIGAGAASACEWNKQAMASAASAPATEQQQPVAATKVDPQLLAYLDELGKESASSVTASQDAQAK